MAEFMTDVTPIAGTGSSPVQPSTFTWTFAGAPIRINFPLGLISRLRNELAKITATDPGENSAEVGGVLLGRPNTATLEIEDYRWIAAEDESDEAFRLTAGMLEKVRSNAGTSSDSKAAAQVVGYFRTQMGGGLRLRSEELALVKEQFPDRSNIVLLIDTQAKPYNAGFFFWMETKTFTPFSLRDFPLDPEILSLQKKPPTATARRRPDPVAPPVPIPTRETAAVEPAAIEPAEEAPQETAPWDVRAARAYIPMKYVAVGLALLALVGISLLNWGGRKSSMGPAPVSASPLHLEVAEQGGGMNVRWNPQSAAILQAREGSLEVQEGNQLPQAIPLDAQQLASGHIYYRSSGERLEFGLAVVDKSGNVTRESVLALSAKPQASASSSPTPAEANLAPAPAERPTASHVAKPTPPAPRRVTPRVFIPPVQERAKNPPSITIDQPPVVSGNTSPPPIGVPASLSRLPAPPVAQPVASAQATKPIVVDGNVQAANLIKRVAPIYPQTALLARIQGNVRFTALIGKDGSVRNLQTVSGDPALVAAAADAVRQWMYRPTLLNGSPVEIVTQIDVSFSLRR